MRTNRTAIAPRTRRQAVAGIRRPRPAPAVSEVADTAESPDPVDSDEPLPEEAESGSSDEVAPEEEHGTGRGVRLPVVLLVVAALLIGAGALALVRAERVSADANVALVDAGGTAEVTRQVREALEKIFTYRHENTAATEDAARDLLTGAASEQYDRLFRQVRAQAPTQRLTLTTRVIGSGVVSLRGDTAVLLVFLDQSAVRGDSDEVTAAGAQLSVTAVRVDGRWRISELVPR